MWSQLALAVSLCGGDHLLLVFGLSHVMIAAVFAVEVWQNGEGIAALWRAPTRCQVVAGFANLISRLLFWWACMGINPAIAGPINLLWIMLVWVFGAAVFGLKMQWKYLIGIGLGVVALWLLMPVPNVRGVAALVSAVIWSRYIAEVQKDSAYGGAGIGLSFLVTGALALGFSAAKEGFTGIDAHTWLLIVVAAGLGSVGRLAWEYGIKAGDSLMLNRAFVTMPFLAMIGAWLAGVSPLSPVLVLGGLLVTISGAVVSPHVVKQAEIEAPA